VRRRGCFVGFLCAVRPSFQQLLSGKRCCIPVSRNARTCYRRSPHNLLLEHFFFDLSKLFFHSAGLRKDFPANVLLTASVADHLESCNAQIAVLHFAGCFLNLPLFFFLILFTFCFVGSGAADCHLVANVLVKLNASAS